MSIVHFITHPEVVSGPSASIPLRPLASEGPAVAAGVDRLWISDVGSVFSSAEPKATNDARLVAYRFGLSPIVVAKTRRERPLRDWLSAQEEFEAVVTP